MRETAMQNTTRGEPFERFFAELGLSTRTSLTGCTGALAALCLAGLAQQSGVTLFVCSDVARARGLEQQVATWLGARSNRVVCMMPERTSIYDQTAADPEVMWRRLAAMASEMNGGGMVIVPLCVMLERFFAPECWLESCFEVKVGSGVRREGLVKKLVSAGYVRTGLVEERGTFTVRGSLLDVFPPDAEFPARLDFFGDELDSIKLFAPTTQRSFDKRDRLSIIPVNEFITGESEIQLLCERITEELQGLDERRASLLRRRHEHLLAHPDSRDYKELKPFVEKGAGYLWDFWKNCRIIVEEHDQLTAVAEEIYDGFDKQFAQLNDLTPLRPPQYYYHRPASVLAGLAERGFTRFSRFGDPENDLFANIEQHPPPSDSSRETLLKELRQLFEGGWAVAIVIEDEQRLNNLRGLLGDRNIRIHSASRPFGIKPASVLFVKGSCGRGFKDYKRRIAIFAEEDIYLGPAREATQRRAASQHGLMSVQQMVPGDIVVHADHGVAEFRGIQTMTAAGRTREYMLLQYAGTDKLYVPTDQVHKVSKYLGMEGFIPRIHSLNSKVWAGQKSRVSKNVEYIARELLELYATRLASTGHAFSPDCDLQRMMEERFPFTETPDQYKAIVATKGDMESQVPMDRLICGDVGYGKTEVAMRAAFKAVCSGKQVAILAPTTLLAFQHYQTLQNRFEGFPVSIDMVSRLRKPAEQKVTLKKAAAGTLDVLIGTHRILSSDIVFRDLGLLIIDEEQRFGVKHKEKLKKLKSNIDVLTLTATPIPRTMQMAMSGIRQISVIDTPPADRRPVQTYVAPFDAAWVKRAVIEELKRGGQIYYVFNRVEFIEQKVKFLRELVPEARIAVAHGQMPEQRVEKTMLDFVQRKYDLLVATTIIESGLDIANVNTLIVDEAERLGLSQMYQLRGRVGRSARQAWAYFFYSKGQRLTKEATERLETIEEHTALGSGFKIALRDLQIRGAGNILGESQSGHIASIGFSLYMELLEEAVTRLKTGKKSFGRIDSSIEIPVTAYFPTFYIADEETRVELYSRLARCNDVALLEEIRDECEDRFGRLPEEAKGLFAISSLRIMAAQVGVKKVARVINHLRFEFAETRLPDIGRLFKGGAGILRQIYFEPKEKNTINLSIIIDSDESVFADAVELLQLLVEVKQQDEIKEANLGENSAEIL
ncbi:MAG: transcription-repair coupling factor [Candidatus Riflebacteria bacterium]|nr:transcription-repair coupling factor [Candidatus Riflebacteria bacterium]